METQTEDCLYEDMPEMCDIFPSSSDENLTSPSLSETKSSSFTVKNPFESDASVQNNKENFVKECACRKRVQWTWDSDSKSDHVEIVNDNMDVRFHKRYSNGTAVVRCTEPMANNQYYWEVEMTYPVYGTDIMVGVGTSEARLNHLEDRFVSFLGMDNKTWGFSYTGLFHHNGQRRCYAQSFGQGNIIGVHLDLWKGTLSFYKDKKHLGVASSGLKGKTLYAMASSTAARSGMRLVRSCSFPSSLQFLCCAKLREFIPDDKNVLDVVDVPPGLKQFLQSKLSWLLEKRNPEQELKTCCAFEDNQIDDEEVPNESSVGSGNANSRQTDHFNVVTSQFFLMGSFLLRNQRPMRGINFRNREGSPETESKRPRLLIVGLPKPRD